MLNLVAARQAEAVVATSPHTILTYPVVASWFWRPLIGWARANGTDQSFRLPAVSPRASGKVGTEGFQATRRPAARFVAINHPCRDTALGECPLVPYLL